MLWHRDVQLEHLDIAGQLAGGALGQTEATAGTGEHDVGTLPLRQLGDCVGQRGVRQHAGDHDVLAVEETHGRRP